MKRIFIALSLLAASSAFAAGTYVGADVGYLTDSEEAFFAAHLGFDVAKSAQLVQGAEIEVGYTSDKESGVKGDIIPVMANYRLTFGEPDAKVSYYIAAGAGASNVRVSSAWADDNAWGFTLQGLAGVNFKVAPNTYLKLGVRYLWIDDVTLLWRKIAVGDDLSVETGISYHF